ncbi:MAG: hypothetical protein ACR2OE_18630, partial [Thermomicrobiales bacterium]
GVLYLEIEDAVNTPEAKLVSLGRWVRTLHYYPDRTTTAYADFDKKTWTFRLGSVEDAQADLEIGVIAEYLPEDLVVSVEIDGEPQRISTNSLLGLRVDYFNGADYTASVLVHGPYAGGPDLYGDGRDASMPWGTGTTPDHVLSVEDFGAFVFSLKDNAPSEWNGRVQITAIMHAIGANVRTRIQLRRA